MIFNATKSLNSPGFFMVFSFLCFFSFYKRFFFFSKKIYITTYTYKHAPATYIPLPCLNVSHASFNVMKTPLAIILFSTDSLLLSLSGCVFATAFM